MATKRSAASSRHGKLVRRSVADIRAYARSSKFEIDAANSLAKGPDPSVRDLKEIPELSDEQLAIFRPVKKAISIRLDADVLAWLKAKGGKYQAHLNAVLRERMKQERRQA